MFDIFEGTTAREWAEMVAFAATAAVITWATVNVLTVVVDNRVEAQVECLSCHGMDFNRRGMVCGK